MPVSNASSWSVLTIIMTQSKTAADFLITVIPTGVLLVLRGLFTCFHKASNFCCFSLTLLQTLFELNTHSRCYLCFYFHLSIPTIPYMHTIEIALVILSNDFLPFPCHQTVGSISRLCCKAPNQPQEFLTPETVFQNTLHAVNLKHVQVKLRDASARTTHLLSHPDLNAPPFFFQKVFFHINIHLSRAVCF